LIESIVAGCDDAGMLLVGGETAEMPDVYQDGHFDLAGFALGELSPDALITGQAIEPGQTLIGLGASGIHSNGLSLARKVLTHDDDKALLLKPTQLYVQPVLSLFERFPGGITGLAHITGGGWRNLCRLNSAVGYAISTPLPVLPVFEKLLAAGIATDEAYKTFNMGMGLAISVSRDADTMVAQLNAQGVAARVIGQVTDDPGRVSVPGLNLTLTHK
jgi:phosphoribosylformylglycinamidine cyclo-ligase